MRQVLHGSARTTEAVRRAIQHSQASLRALAECGYATKRNICSACRSFAWLWLKRARVGSLAMESRHDNPFT